MTTENQLRDHKIISYFKSVIRIGACIGAGSWSFTHGLIGPGCGFFGLGLAEVLGIIEETVVE